MRPPPHLDREPLGVVSRRDEIDLLDVEAEAVDPLDPLGDPVALVGGDRLRPSQLGPEVAVALGDVEAELEVGVVEVCTRLGGDVGHSAATFSIMISRSSEPAPSLSGPRTSRRSRRRP